jgi:hypothetical protein
MIEIKPGMTHVKCGRPPLRLRTGYMKPGKPDDDDTDNEIEETEDEQLQVRIFHTLVKESLFKN